MVASTGIGVGVKLSPSVTSVPVLDVEAEAKAYIAPPESPVAVLFCITNVSKKSTCSTDTPHVGAHGAGAATDRAVSLI